MNDPNDMARLADGCHAVLNDLMARHAEKLLHYRARHQLRAGLEGILEAA